MTKTKKWSNKYKRTINCKRPKGFSQKQYCKYGRKKTMKGGGRGDKELKVIKIDNETYKYKVVTDKIIVFNDKKKINEGKFRKHENKFREQLPENIKYLNIEIKLTDKKTTKQPPLVYQHKPEDIVIPPSFSKRQPTIDDMIKKFEEEKRIKKENKIGYSTLPKQAKKSNSSNKSNSSIKKQISETSTFSELGDSSNSK
jgi:hypothetical protein